MKKLFLTSLLIFYVIFCLNAQKNDFGLDDPEHLLDGYSFNYQYQSGTAIHIEFSNGELTYLWIAGPNKGKPVKTLPYQSRKIEEDVFLINWHEPSEKNFITLVFNLKNRVVSSSVIVRYGTEKQRIAFEGGIIEHVQTR